MAKRTYTTGPLADPEFRRQRARKAALARTTIDAHIDKLVAAPALTVEQVDKLRSLLPAPGHEAAVRRADVA